MKKLGEEVIKERKRKYMKKYRSEHRKQIKEQKKKYSEKHTEEKKKYDREYRRTHRKSRCAKTEEEFCKNSKMWHERYKKTADNRRIEILNRLSNNDIKCTNPDCLVIGGCRDVRCLQIDHINGGGWIGGATKTYKVMLEMSMEELKSKYQILCANCNTIKGKEERRRSSRWFGINYGK